MRGRKRMLALCMAAVIAAMPVTAPRSLAAQGADSGNLSEKLYYEVSGGAEELSEKALEKADLVISTAEELKKFAEEVNDGNYYDYAGKVVRLGADIVFDGTTVNNFETIKDFAGVFDGMGHTISGIVQERTWDVGLFGIVYKGGVVKDLTLKNCKFTLNKQSDPDVEEILAGAICEENVGMIRNCRVVDCEISCTKEEWRCWCYAGGVAGVNRGTVDGCSVENTVIDGHFFLGGIAGTSNGVSTIKNCRSSATVNARKAKSIDSVDKWAGGIAGRCEGIMMNCCNVGKISFVMPEGEADEPVIHLGGLAGEIGGTVKNCYNSGEIACPALKKPEGYDGIGGIAGTAAKEGASCSFCYYSKSGPKEAVGRGTAAQQEVSAMEDTQMKSADFAALLDKNRGGDATLAPWKIKDGCEYPLPEKFYEIDAAGAHGKVSCDAEYAYAGRTVSFSVAPNEGYQVSVVRVNTASGKEVAVTAANSGYSFTMPEERTSIDITYSYGDRVPVEECKITLSETEYTYTGEALKPSVTVKFKKKTLKEGTDYEVSYSSNTNVGTGIVTVSGKGDYIGTDQAEFEITKAEQVITVGASSYEKTYGDKAFSLKAKVPKKGGQLTYVTSDKKVATVDAKGKVTLKAPGYAVITVKAWETRNFERSEKEVEITVAPKQVKLSKLTPQSGKKMKVEWKAQKASGYLVEYSTDKEFENAKTVTVKSGDKTQATLKGLKKGSTYYVRVTAYQEIVRNGEKEQVKGAPSRVRSKKIK